MSEVNYDYDWVGEERDYCDYADMECVGNHDCINCWFMSDVLNFGVKQSEESPQK